MHVDTKRKWEKGMKEETNSLVNNQTWDLVQFPAGKRALQNKWVYRLNEEDGVKKAVHRQTCCKVVCRKERYRF